MNKVEKATLQVLPVLFLFALQSVVYAGEAADQWKALHARVGMEKVATQKLTSKDMVTRILENNAEVESKRLNMDSAKTNIKRAEAAFTPQVNLSLEKARAESPNDIEDKSTLYTDIYTKKSLDASASVSKRFTLGTQVEARVSQSKYITSTMLELDPEEQDNYKVFYGLNLTQPLLRDAGFDANLAPLRVAGIGVAIAKEESKNTNLQMVGLALTAYTDLMVAQHKADLSREKIGKTKKLLGLVKNLYNQGRLAQIDVWEVENSLVKVQATLNEDLQRQREVSNNLKRLLGHEGTVILKATDNLPKRVGKIPSFSECMQGALENRPDIRAKQLIIKQEDEQISFAENQALPRLDLVGSYGLNGLDYDALGAYDGNTTGNASWSIGVKASFPLGENKQGKADIESANIRKQQGRVALQALEVAVAADVDTSLNALMAAGERWQYWQGIAGQEQKRVNLAIQGLDAGRTDVREILYLEDRLIDTKLMLLQQRAAYAKADVKLAVVRGNLLERFAQ